MAYEIDLSGRVALVTGASGGLGAQFAKTLASAGAGVVLASINAMSEDARRDPTWVYWKARALLATAPAVMPHEVVALLPAADGKASANAPVPVVPPVSPQRAEALALYAGLGFQTHHVYVTRTLSA